MRCIFSGTPFHTPPLLLRLEDHLSNFFSLFGKIDVSAFMMIDKFHNGDLAFDLCEKAFILSGFWNHSYWYLYHISRHTLLLVTRTSVWGKCSLQQNKNKKHQTKHREVGILRGKQCRAMLLTVYGLGGHKPHPHPWQGLLPEAPPVAVLGWWPLTFLKLSLSWGSVTWPLLWVCEYIPSDWKTKIAFPDATQNDAFPVGTPLVTWPPSTLWSCSGEACSALMTLEGCRGFRNASDLPCAQRLLLG